MAAERAEMAAREQSFRDAANAAQALLQSYEADLTLLRSKNQDLNEKVADLTGRLVDEGDARRRAENELAEVRRDVAEKEARFNNRIAEMESRMDTMRQEHAAALVTGNTTASFIRGADGSVLPIRMNSWQRASAAPEIHHLRPLITYSSPSRSMRHSMLVASELATAGSVMAKAERISPSSSG